MDALMPFLPRFFNLSRQVLYCTALRCAVPLVFVDVINTTAVVERFRPSAIVFQCGVDALALDPVPIDHALPGAWFLVSFHCG